MSQEELADRAKIDRTYVSAIERSVYAATIDVVDRLARGLGVEAAPKATIRAAHWRKKGATWREHLTNSRSDDDFAVDFEGKRVRWDGVCARDHYRKAKVPFPQFN